MRISELWQEINRRRREEGIPPMTLENYIKALARLELKGYFKVSNGEVIRASGVADAPGASFPIAQPGLGVGNSLSGRASPKGNPSTLIIATEKPGPGCASYFIN